VKSSIDGTKSRAHNSKKALQLKENLDVDCFTVLVDKSYQNGRKLPMHKQ
jgi:hypothetical protein